VTYSRWDVVAVEFPFIEGTDAKRRPGLIVSSDRLHRDQGIFWIVMITTAKTGQRLGDIPVTNLERAGLSQECVIRVARITAIVEGRIARKLGDITPKDRTAVSALLKQYAP
jgi:mRNA-degrading endonuclease toxin of MazEF toxin-antitoxin module